MGPLQNAAGARRKGKMKKKGIGLSSGEERGGRYHKLGRFVITEVRICCWRGKGGRAGPVFHLRGLVTRR